MSSCFNFRNHTQKYCVIAFFNPLIRNTSLMQCTGTLCLHALSIRKYWVINIKKFWEYNICQIYSRTTAIDFFLVKNNLNEHKIYCNFWFLIEKILRNLSRLLRNLRNLSSLLCNLPYLSLLNSFVFLSKFSVSLKSLDNYFFRWFAYKSLFRSFLVLINYNMCSSNHFSTSSRFPRFSGIRFSGSRLFRVWVQVLEVAE